MESDSVSQPGNQKAEIIEHDFAELVRPVIKKYVPAENVEQGVQAVVNDPSRVLVVLHPEKIVTN